MTSFPNGWFFIKNLNNGYVLSISTEKSVAGEPVIIASPRNRDYETQLWQYSEDGRLHNKQSGFILDISKGLARVGSEIVQQNDHTASDGQTFGLSAAGHIFLSKNPTLVIGIKESFFTRREGQHVHLQDIEESSERKEQRWSCIVPDTKRSAAMPSPMDSLKRTISGASLRSYSSGSASTLHSDASSLDESARNQLNSFPESEFFIKSDLTGHFVGVDLPSSNSSGGRLTLEPLRKNNYESQLWHYDFITGRLINKNSSFFLTAEDLADDSCVCQSSSATEKDLTYQSWILTNAGEIKLKNAAASLVLGFKKDNWLGLNREGTRVLLQKQAETKTHSHQRFVVVLPVFTKKTTEIVTVTEQIGVFPEGYFFIKNQKHGLAIGVTETDKLAAQVVAFPLDIKDYNRQLWKYSDGFLFNKASKMVLDVRGGCIIKGSEICQYKQKNEGFENQQWGLSAEGYIHAKSHKDIVLSVDSNNKNSKVGVFLANKKTPDHEEQRWNFVLPVFKQKSTPVTKTTVQKSVCYHHYAQYPSGYFFIRSLIEGTVTESPLVLTADSSSHRLDLSRISKEQWQNQLWMYWNGVLINFATQLAIDVDNVAAGSAICQGIRQAGSVTQRWSLTVDGYLVHGSNPSLTLKPEEVAKNQYTLVLTDHLSVQQQHRWGLLTPEVKFENGMQILVRWSLTLLTEWKNFNEQSVQKVVHRIAYWPEESFFITGQDGYALVPEKSESFSFIVIRKLEFGQSESFKWVYRNGYLVHVATGLVLHASDDLVGGSQLQIREQISVNSTIDKRQRWAVKTDGSIVSGLKDELGLALLQQGDQYHIQLAYTSTTSEHYCWSIVRGHYENRYSEIYKKEVQVISRTERILLAAQTQRHNSSSNTHAVSYTTGVFPGNWFYIRSKADKSLVLTAPDSDEGSKLTISKMDYSTFRLQLWHVQDDGCLVNLGSNFVIDIAGGAFDIGSDIIQWHEKFLERHRKNQVWSLSPDGHIYPKSRPGLVLGIKGDKAHDGSQIQLQSRGSLDLEYQIWTFATPNFRKMSISAGVLESSDSNVQIDSVDEKEFGTVTSERHELKEKTAILHRWGIFPEGGFFIRSGYGENHLALTVEKKARKDENGRTEYEVTLRPINFKEYQWHLWIYEDSHLINTQTGLALDASSTKGLLVEDGLRTPLFVRDKSMSDKQFWSLTVSGEVYLRSDERLVIGISNSRRASVSGAQVGLRELKLRNFTNENNQQERTLKSEKWLRWIFSKPIYGKSSVTTTTTTSTSVTEENLSVASGLVAVGQVVEGLTDETFQVDQKEELSDYSIDEEDSEEFSTEEETAKLSKTSSIELLKNVGIATAGASILANAADKISSAISSAPKTLTSVTTGKQEQTQEFINTSQVAKNTSYKSLKYDRKESFHTSVDYTPTGYEKVVRYRSHNQPNFPPAGYFMIKNHLHGFVLDVVNGDARDGAYAVLSAIRSSNFASQLWTLKDGRLFNLKGHNLVLDASMTDTITAGERVVISTQKNAVGLSDQHWEFSIETGQIVLKSKRSLVLSIKELKRVSDQTAIIEVYLQEEKAHHTNIFGRPEQRWEIIIPAMVPIEQTTSAFDESRYTIIEAGKIAAISSSVSAVLAFKWLKETFHHKITTDNQWPGSDNWFFIRVGNENAFLSSGLTYSSEVKFTTLGDQEDHKQFLWAYVNGYLINYKYVLRLVYDNNNKKLVLSSSTETLDQTFQVSKDGRVSVNTSSKMTYFAVSSNSKTSSYELITSESEIVDVAETTSYLQFHIPVFSDTEVQKEANIALSAAVTWAYSIQKNSSITTTATETSQVTQRYGVFPTATWFFAKVVTKGGDTLVLTAKDSSMRSGDSLVLMKMSFKNFKSQLWTYRSGLLINYGSKLVLDVQGDIAESSILIQSNEAGTSSQKWCLSVDGRIQLDSYKHLLLGSESTETLVEGSEISLVDVNKSGELLSKYILWRFSVPIFSKQASVSTETSNTTTTVVSTVSSIERITACIEQGYVIESVEDADIKTEDTFVKKNNCTESTSSSKVSENANEKHHSFQNTLTSAGIAITTATVAVAAVGGLSKVMDKVHERTEEKKGTNAVLEQLDKKQEENSKISTAITDSDKHTETIVIHRSKSTSIQVIEESQTIVRAWNIVFSQRIHHCASKVELVQTVEECREDLFRRLDEHLRVHASLEHLVSGATPQWHVSIHQVKELYRARVFEKLLDRLRTDININMATELDFDAVLSSASEEIERHYQSAIESQSEIAESDSSNSAISKLQASEVSTHEQVLITIDNIKIVVRYWVIDLCETISNARSKKVSEEEIKAIVEKSRNELTEKLVEIKQSVSNEVGKSSSVLLASKQTSINSTIDTAIKQTETVVSSQVTLICSEAQYTSTEEHWINISRNTEEQLSTTLKVYQNAIAQEISEVQKTESEKCDQVKLDIVLDEKMIAVAQQTVANKLVETKTKISSWYTDVGQQILWLLEEKKTASSSIESTRKDTIIIADAALIEIATRIEETKLVVRAYYAHLTYLSWAERRRIEYSLDCIKASLTAGIIQFKKSVEKSDTVEHITRYSTYSFGATTSRLVLNEVQNIVTKVTNVKETTTVINANEQVVKTDKSMSGVIVAGSIKDSTDKITEIQKVTTQNVTIVQDKQDKQDSTAKKIEIIKTQEVKISSNSDASKQSKVIDQVETEVEETKVSKIDLNKQSSASTSASVSASIVGQQQKDKEDHHVSSSTIVAVGAATAALAGTALYEYFSSKQKTQQEQNQKQKKPETAVTDVPFATKTNIAVGKVTETIHTDTSNTSSSTKQEKSESLIVVCDQTSVILNEWVTALNKRVLECAQKKNSNVREEIDAIVSESQQQLVIEIEKAKRATTAVIGTSQTSFHDSLSWIRTAVWEQTVEIKRIGYEAASSTEASTLIFEEKLESLKVSTMQKVESVIEKTKKSAALIHAVDHKDSATIASGKKFEGVDYSKNSYGESIEITKVSVGIFIEETRVTLQRLFREMIASAIERRKQGGENVQEDIEVIIKSSRLEIESYVNNSKTEFEKKITSVHKSSSTTEIADSSKVKVELINETIKKVHSTLEQVQESVMVQVSQVEKVNTSTTIVSEVEYTEKVTAISSETIEKLNTALMVSETIIGHHTEVVAESFEANRTSSTNASKSEQTISTTSISLGVEYGLLLIAETTKTVSSQVSALIESIHHRSTTDFESFEQDVTIIASKSEKELDVTFEQAKSKIVYELSMVSSNEKQEEEKLIAALETLHASAKSRITQIQTIATVHRTETKTMSEKLLQVAEESRHEVASHYESIKQSLENKTEKVSQVIHNDTSTQESSGSSTVISHSEEEKKRKEFLKKQERKSSYDTVEKVLKATAAVAAGSYIASKISDKLSEHTEEIKRQETVHNQTVVVVEDVKIQFNKWISSLTETVATQTKETTITKEEVSETIEKSKTEFLEVIRKAKSNEVITESHQQEILSWIEQTVISQATRVQEIVSTATQNTAYDVESRLEVLKTSTSQEVEIALEKCKESKSSTVKFVGVSADHLRQKEAALLDIKSELVVVIQDVKSSLVSFFHTFTQSVTKRVSQGGDNIEKDVAIIVGNTRSELSSYIENVKNTASSRLSALETKSSIDAVSVAALSGVATAEILRVLKSSEELLMNKINHVHSRIWYIEKDQDLTEVVQSITQTESETTVEINEKIESTKHGFVTAIHDHQKCGHICTEVTEVNSTEEHYSVLKVSLTVKEIKVTIREWLRSLAEKVSACSQKGGSAEEIDIIIKKENDIVFEYLDTSVTTISQGVKDTENIKYLHSTVEEVKSSISKTSSEIKAIGVEHTGYSGFDKMTSVVTQYEKVISEVLVTYDSKVSSSVSVEGTKKNEEVKKEQQSSQKQLQQTIKQDMYTVIAVEYITSTVHTWLEELMVEVSECAKREHNITVVTKQLDSIIAEYKEFISAEFDTIIKKVNGSKNNSTSSQELVNIIEWTRGMALQSSTQVQAIGVNCAVSFSTSGGIEQMRPLVGATEEQIRVAVGRCSKTIKIDVERNSSHCEKKKIQSECRKEKHKKTDCDAAKKKEEEIKKKKEDELKKKAKKQTKKYSTESESDSGSESDSDSCKKASKTSKTSVGKKAVIGAVIGAVIAGASQKIISNVHEVTSESESDSDVEKEKLSNISSSKYTTTVTVVVAKWYEKLITDVSERAKKGGVGVTADIEIIADKAITSITESLHVMSINSSKYITDTATSNRYQVSIEWAKNLAIQSIDQIKTIGINSAVSSSSSTGGIEQMRPISVAIQEQVSAEITRYKLIETVSETKNTEVVTVVEQKQNSQVVSKAYQSSADRKEYCAKLEKHVADVVADSKVTIIACFSQLVRDVSIRIHQGGSSVELDVNAIIEKSKSELESTVKRTQNKFVSTINLYEEDKTFSLIESQLTESLKTIQTAIVGQMVEIQEITAKHHTETEVTEKLSTVLETSKVTISETLEHTSQQSVTVIQQEAIQIDSTIKIVDIVNDMKISISKWHEKLSEEITEININSTIQNKEERINTLIQQATTTIEEEVAQAKNKISTECNNVKKISKSKEQELVNTIDVAHDTFTSDIKKIQEVVKKSDTNIKETLSSIAKSSRQKTDTILTRATAVVVGVAAASMAIHVIKKHNEETKKIEQEVDNSSRNEWSVNVQDNVQVLSEWFKLYTKRIFTTVEKKEGDVVQNITSVSDHAEQEITEIIKSARINFTKRLSHENLNQEAYNYACKHYEESLEAVRVSIVSHISESKNVAIEAHTTGRVDQLEAQLTKLTMTSTESIRVAMGSSAVIKHTVQSGTNGETGAVTDIHVQEDDVIVVGESDVDIEHKESSVITHYETKLDEKTTEKVEEKKQGSIEKIVSSTFGIGKKQEKEEAKKQTILEVYQELKFDSGVATTENSKILISAWLTSLVQRVSNASKSGASSQKITVIVEESRTELDQIVEHVKSNGSIYCSSASDEQQFISKIEWISSVAHNQATQIQQIGINGAASKADLTSQMQALATASYHQIEVTLEQLKTSINFHQKINKINSKTEADINKVETVVAGKVQTSVEKTKAAYSVIQVARASTIVIFVALSERIVTRIRQGGSDVQEDINKMIESSQKEVTKVFNEAKTTTSTIDKKVRIETEEALATVQKTIQEQITEVKNVTTEVVNTSKTDSNVAVEKVLEVSKNSKTKIENSFTTVAETVAASLIIVTKTAQKATESVQGWFSELTAKIDHLLEASDCTEEEKQTKINTVISEAEIEMNTKIVKLQETASVTKKTSTTEVSTDHHLDVFFGNIKSTVQNQLNAVKSAVQDTSRTDVTTIKATLEKTQSKLEQETNGHCQAVKHITTVEHITGIKKDTTTQIEKGRYESYKDTLEKAAIGAVAVAAAASLAISFHKQGQETKTTAVQVVKETSIKDVQMRVDIWFSELAEKITARTKKGDENVSVDVAKIVEQAQAELEVTLAEVKRKYSSNTTTSTSTTTTTVTDSKRTFESTLEWVKTTAISQSSQITEIVKQSSSSSIDITTQIENHVLATKHQISSALEVHSEKYSSAISQETVKTTSSSALEKKETVTNNIVEIITESREQTQKRFSLETTVTVQEYKTRVNAYLVLLLENITTIIHSNSESIRKDIFSRIGSSEKELDVLIQEMKTKFVAASKATATSHVEAETQILVVNSVKQTLDCIDNLKITLLLQLNTLREAINSIEVEDIDIINERLESIISRTRERVYHTLEAGISLAISSAFEGKVVTWSETSTIPESFSKVRAVAFDLIGTIANYQKSLETVWRQVLTPKNDISLNSIEFNTFAEKWFHEYSGIKKNHHAEGRVISDKETFGFALTHTLKHFNIENSFTEPETSQLCAAWNNIGVYNDALIGVRRLKSQKSKKYSTIAISDTLSTRTMIDFAQNNGLCWHAQFSAEMFARSSDSSTNVISESLVKGTIQLLGLDQANELAIVSSNPELIATAKSQGCQTVMVERGQCYHSETNTATVATKSVDITVDGIDVFGESVQIFLEHESTAQVWKDKDSPSAPRVFVQQLK